MKRIKFWRLLSLTLALGAIGFAAACKSGDESSSSGLDDSTTIASVTLNKTAVTLDLLEKTTLVPIVENVSGSFVWNSSNPEVATVSESGEVVALKEGATTITVVCGEYSAQCSVTVVASGIRPILSVTGKDEGLTVLKGNTFPLEASLSYNGEAVDIANFTYSTNSDIITVSQEGLLTAVNAGSAQVTVGAVWGNFEEYAIVNVEVVKDSALLCEQANLSLSSTDGTGVQLQFNARVDGEAVANPEVTYEYDQTLVSIDANGYVKNVAGDDARTVIKAIYAVSATETLTTNINVNLVFEKIDKTELFNDYRFVGNRTSLASQFESCFEGDGSHVTKVFDTADLTKNLLDSNGNLQLDSKYFGEREWLVYSSNRYACYVKGMQITAEIATAEEFQNAFLLPNWTKALVTSSNPTDTYWSGYYVLTADIDLGGYTGSSKFKAYNDGVYHAPVKGAGFEGVIDGQGHTVSNFELYGTLASLFGTIGMNGTVKNLGVLVNGVWEQTAGAFAFGVYGTLENVFVAGDYSAREFNSQYFGNIAYVVGGAKFKNVVSYVTGVKKKQRAGAFMGFETSPCQFENCYAVYGNNVLTPSAKEGLTAYTFYEFELVGYDYDGYESTLWDTNGSLPVFKTAKSGFEIIKEKEVGNLTKSPIDATGLTLFSNVGEKKAIQLVDEGGNAFTGATFVSSDSSVLVVNAKGIVSALTPGKATITVTLAGGTQKSVTIKSYEYIEISTREQFMEAFTTAHYGFSAGVSSEAKDTYYGAYKWYALTQDIDFGKYAVTSRYPAFVNSNYTAADLAGFYGVFDGQGHTIYNFDDASTEDQYEKYKLTSFFGTIGKEGVVKNVAFMPRRYFANPSSVIAITVFGTLENVFIGLDHSGNQMFTEGYGALAYATDGATIKNCVTYVGGYAKKNDKASPFVAIMHNTTVVNSYCVYGNNVTAPTSGNGLTVYSFDEYKDQTYDYSGYDSSIWHVGESLPVMNSILSLRELQASNTELNVNEEITIGVSEENKNYVDITASAGTIKLEPTSTSRTYLYVADDTLYGKVITFKFYMFGNLSGTMEMKVNVGEITLELNAVETMLFANKDGEKTWQIMDKNGNALDGARFNSTNEDVATVDANGLVTAKTAGETVINVTKGTDYGAVVVKVYEYIEISTRAQFMETFTVGNYENPVGTSTVPSETRYGEYKWYALTQDIDFELWAVTTKYKSYDTSNNETRVAVDGAGFAGVFDGQGHVLKNFAMYKGSSLFGTIGKEGVVKNVGLIVDNIFGGVNSVLALSVFGTIENVFLAFDLTDKKDFTPTWFGALAYWSDCAKFRNCVVYAGGAFLKGGDSFVPIGTGTFENCYVVNGNNMSIKTARTGVTVYELDDYAEQTYDYTSFDTSIWATGNGLPVFKTALNGFEMQTGKTSITPTETITVSATQGDRNYVSLTASAGTLTAQGKSYSYQADASLVGEQVTVKMSVFGHEVDTLALNVSEALNESSKTLFSNKTDNKTWQIANEDGEALVGVSYESQNMSIAKVSASGLVTAQAPGKTYIDVKQGSAVTSIEIKVYEYIEISTRAQFMESFTVGHYAEPTGMSSDASATRYGEYKWYALTQDIDFERYAVSSKYPAYESGSRVAVDGAGFAGVFDGQGHVLKNFDMWRGHSLFGTIGKEGVIKNVGLMPKAYFGNINATLALSAFGTIDNVFVAFDMTGSSSFGSTWFGGLCYWIDGATIKNTVVYAGGAPAAGGRSFVPYGNGTVQNCYAVNGTNFTSVARTGLTAYSKDEYKSKTYDYTGFDTNIWNTTSGLPYFKNSATLWADLTK